MVSFHQPGVFTKVTARCDSAAAHHMACFTALHTHFTTVRSNACRSNMTEAVVPEAPIISGLHSSSADTLAYLKLLRDNLFGCFTGHGSRDFSHATPGHKNFAGFHARISIFFNQVTDDHIHRRCWVNV